MFITYESNFPSADREIKRSQTFDEAFYDLKGDPNCLFVEKDEDHAGCADAYMKGNMIYCIEPLHRYEKRHPHVKTKIEA